MSLNLFVPITKVDLDKREVWGRVAEERVDKTGREKFDYAESKPYFQAWIADFEQRTASTGAAKSLGNIRYMHQPEAVGRAIAWDFNDAEKAIDVGVKIVDDACWTKIVEGVLTGFSIGGHYKKTWADPDEKGVTRYAAEPVETSVVDNPCMYGATFTAVKADGTTQVRKFKGATMDVAAQLTALVPRIDALATKARALDGGLTLVARLAEYLDSLKWMVEGVLRDYSDSPEKLPAAQQLAQATVALAEAFLALAEVCVEEIVGANGDNEASATLTLAALLGELTKMEPTEARKVLRRVQKMHDLAVECGANCGDDEAAKTAQPAAQGDKDMDEATLTKLLGDHTAGLMKGIGETINKAVADGLAPVQKAVDAATAAIDAVKTVVDAQGERIKQLEDRPAGGATPITRAVPRTDDAASAAQTAAEDAALAKLPPAERAVKMLSKKLGGPGLPLKERPQGIALVA